MFLVLDLSSLSSFAPFVYQIFEHWIFRIDTLSIVLIDSSSLRSNVYVISESVALLLRKEFNRRDVHARPWILFPIFAIFAVAFGLLVLPDMIDSEGSTKYFGSREIVDSQNSRTLVFVLQKCETLGFPSLFITNKIDVQNFAILTENAYYITLGEFEG